MQKIYFFSLKKFFESAAPLLKGEPPEHVAGVD
jgi:hypothetical protein